MLKKSLILSALFPFLSLTAWAASNKAETAYLLSAGAGVSAPSLYNGTRDNPSAVAFNSGVRLQALGIAWSPTFNPITTGVHLILGNGTVGGQVGMEMAIPGAISPVVRGAIAGYIKAIKTAVGLNCQVSLASAVSVSCGNLGLLFNPEGTLRGGLTLGLAGLFGGAAGFPVAAGAALNLAQMFTLALDAGTTIGGAAAGVSLVPALGFRIAMVQLSAGYGFSIGSAAASGFTAGAGVLLGKSFHLMAHYNHLSWGMVSAVYRF